MPEILRTHAFFPMRLSFREANTSDRFHADELPDVPEEIHKVPQGAEAKEAGLTD